MSYITACRPSRIEPNPVRRRRFIAAVRRAAIVPASLPRQRCLSSLSWASRIQCQLLIPQCYRTRPSNASGVVRRLVIKRWVALNGLRSRVPVAITSAIQLVPCQLALM